MRDVVVVGAGPAGTSTAKELADKGFDVKVYEKRQEIGAPKRCGEGMSARSIKNLGLDIPDYCKMQPVDGARVYSPSSDSVAVDFEETAGWIFERKQFDKWMAQRAAESGADVRARATVTGLLPENRGVRVNVEGETVEEKARIVVAADGVESLIAKKAGIRGESSLKLVDSGYQYEMANLDLEYPHKIILYFGNEVAPRGYGWIFPKGESRANVGVGILGEEKRTAKHYLDEFIKNGEGLENGSILEVNSGAIPVGGFLDNMVTENCLAVGDSANQVNPIHGGGMKEGVKAGKIASEVISEALEEGDTSEENLQEYNERWWNERGERLRKIEKIREVLEDLEDEDLNFLAKNLDGDDIYDLAHGKALTKLGEMLLKRPKMIKAAKKLI